MGSQKVETLDNGQSRVTPFRAPYNESDRNRVQQVGPFRRANVAANLSATAMTLGGVDSDAPGTVRLARSGKILGTYTQQSAALAAGNITLQPKKGSTGVGTTTVLTSTSGTKIVKNFATPVAFKGLDDVAPDDLGIDISGDGSVSATTTDVMAFLIVQFDP